MKTSQSNQEKPAGGVDDLTRFLDEDFGTEDVDLFEFTTEQDSPLTQLKSIILSLDWEISAETLHDLADEIEHLKHIELFESDKVSQVYLQGLAKIGQYLQSEGAHAHPNSIKLLLTLYYDFEKILSSEHITGAEITALLKADVRKFKVLQYQIGQRHGATAATEEVAAPLPLTEHKDLQGVQAAILELDWEVTDNGLKNLGEQLDILKEQYADNRYTKVVIQGLHSLNTYIIEERGRAHPETFSLLHNFYDALETLVEQPDLEEEKRQDILIDCVNRLNNLKHLIAQTYPEEVVEAEAITPIAEGEEPPAAETAPATAVGEPVEEAVVEPPVTAEVPTEPVFPPEQRKAPAAAEEDLEEVAIFGTDVDEHSEIAPALADSGEEGGFGITAAEEAPPDELTEKLDFFFGEEKEEFQPETIEKEAAEKAAEQPAPEFEALEAPADEITPALAGSFEDQGFRAEAEPMTSPAQELTEKLDFFFGEEEGKPGVEKAEAPAPAGGEEEPSVAFAAEPEEEALPGFEGEEIAPALAEHGEEVGFGGRGTQLEAPPEELAEKLDFFFGEDEEKPVPPAEEPFAPAEIEPALAEEPAVSFAAEPEREEPAPALAEEPAGEEVTPALAGFGEETGFTGGEQGMEAPPSELAEKLDFFFGDERPAPAAEAPPAETEEEEVLLTPALAAAPEKELPTFEGVATAADYQVALNQMREEFQKIEAALRQQIEDLRTDIQSLRSQLKS